MDKDYLKKEFAYMFQTDHGQTCASRYGIESHDGWNNLLYNLLTIVAIIDKDKNIRIQQIKSKFAGLRFYISWVGKPRRPTLHDKLVDFVNWLPWIIRKKIFALGFQNAKKWDPTHERIHDIATLFEQASFCMCEDCGEPATLKDTGHWLFTLCDKCWHDMQVMRELEKQANNENLLGSGHLQPQDI